MVRVDYPLGNPSLSTIIRIELLSGESYAHLLSPGENAWQLPESASPDIVLRRAQRGVLDGVEHLSGHGVHLVLAGVIALVGSASLVMWFSLGQIAALAAWAILNIGLQPSVGELGLTLALVLLAREALRPADERRQVKSLLVVAGLAHGLAIATEYASAPAPLFHSSLMVLGMDAALWLTVTAASALVTRLRYRRVVIYGLAAAAVALGLGLVGAEDGAPQPSRAGASRLPGLSRGSADGRQSERLSPRAPDEAVQSFVSIEAFEVRHEILVRLDGIVPTLDLEPGGLIEVDAQRNVLAGIRDLLLSASAMTIDDEAALASEPRLDFMTVNDQGALPRPTPIAERVDDAFVGFTTSYFTRTTPRRVSLTWTSFLDGVPTVPITVTDPEASVAGLLTSEAPALSWENQLTRDPVPTIEASSIEPRLVPIPLVSIVLAIAGVTLGVTALRRDREGPSSGLARVALAAAMLAAPVGAVAVPVPVATTDSPETARRILAGLLPNVYRAFEYRDESQSYDRLAVSVTGETLTDIYLEHQRALEMEERGGARASVEAVEVSEVSSVEPLDGGGFVAEATWQVGGNVTHFGHRHFRQNRYEARVTVEPVEQFWKIRAIEILEESRVK